MLKKKADEVMDKSAARITDMVAPDLRRRKRQVVSELGYRTALRN
jgi:hypothetical protein